MNNFADQLVNKISDLGSPICVGLDPHFGKIPQFLKDDANRKYGEGNQANAEAVLQFNHQIIDAIAGIVPAVKPQIAFYELLGHEGFRAYEETIKYAQSKGLLVIGDVKRNDIGSTAAAYAEAHLVNLGADSVTVTPYLGSDGITPFTEVCKVTGKGIFVLVRTSNPSSDEIQSQPVGDMLLDEHVATLVEGWGRDLIGETGFSSVGAVVGATYPEEARLLRNLMPNQIFLVPGYGAQGGGAQDVKPCFHKNGSGAIVNSSRGIIFAYQNSDMPEESFAQSARTAAIAMKEDLSQLFN